MPEPTRPAKIGRGVRKQTEWRDEELAKALTSRDSTDQRIRQKFMRHIKTAAHLEAVLVYVADEDLKARVRTLLAGLV